MFRPRSGHLLIATSETGGKNDECFSSTLKGRMFMFRKEIDSPLMKIVQTLKPSGFTYHSLILYDSSLYSPFTTHPAHPLKSRFFRTYLCHESCKQPAVQPISNDQPFCKKNRRVFLRLPTLDLFPASCFFFVASCRAF